MTKRDKVTVDDIIGIVHTDEPTDSVEEVCKLRGRENRTEKRFTITQDFEEHHRQIRDNGKIVMGCFVQPQAEAIVNLLNELADENEQLKQFKTKTFEILKHNIQEASEWKKLDMSNSEKIRLQFLESILIGIERELEKMTEKRSICLDCRHQRGTWINDREIDTWCAIKQNINCDKVFECDDFME